jgi:hypothetical protein
MAEVKLTTEDLARVEAVCEELDPSKHPFTRPHLEDIPDQERRQALTDFFREYLRGELIAGVIGQAVCRAMVANGAAEDDFSDAVYWDFVERHRQVTDLERGEMEVRGRFWSCNFDRMSKRYLWAAIVPPPGAEELIQSLWSLLDVANEEMFGYLGREVLEEAEAEAEFGGEG